MTTVWHFKGGWTWIGPSPPPKGICNDLPIILSDSEDDEPLRNQPVEITWPELSGVTIVDENQFPPQIHVL